MVADDVDDRAVGPPGVVEVGQPVAEPGPEVEQRGRRPTGHPGVPVGGAGGHPLEQGQDAAHPGTSSSAATKCISEVPGFMKQVSTPWSTRVRISAWAPFTGALLRSGRADAGAGASTCARVEDARGVERRLDPAHQLELDRVLELGERRQLGRADPVLAGDGTAQPDAGGQDVVDELASHRRVGLEHRQVDVAVPGVAAPDHQRSGGRGQVGHRRQEGGDGGPGHDHVDDVVGAGRLRRPEGLLPGRDQVVARRGRAARRRRGRRASASSPASASVSSSSAVLVVALEDDHQVGERLLAGRRRGSRGRCRRWR